ncbi:allantoicase, partial [Mesorhizobium sp. M8A.F.Ca.ET.059.01.1.1]
MNMIGKTKAAEDAYAMPGLQENFATEVDLASRWLGGSVLAASDESFGEKESLLTPTPSAFVPGTYGPRGEIVDGWETRRRREPGHDWALIRLGAAGIITAVDVDTSFFTGNFPTTCRIEACGVEGYPSPKALQSGDTEWVEIVPRSPLKGDTHNCFEVSDRRRFTHIRLSAFPDGGIARLRVFGHVVADPRLFDGLTIDLASQDHGGQVVTSSDGFYTSAAMLNRPDKARNMGDGWETRRRRDDGNDHVIIRLALPGMVPLVEIDTAHFKYNASAEIALYGATGEGIPQADSDAWRPLLSRRPLQPDTRHVFPLPAGASAISFERL